jgi:hypothetical protein
VGPEKEIMTNMSVIINGEKIVVGVSSHKIAFMNILGMDFMMKTKQLKYSLPGMFSQTVTLEF